jgi:hypothetical protein
MDKEKRARMLRFSVVEVRGVTECMVTWSLPFFILMSYYLLFFLYLTAVMHGARRLLNESLIGETVDTRSRA